MNTGAQDWTMSDAAHERLVLTKNDGEPRNFGEVCGGRVILTGAERSRMVRNARGADTPGAFRLLA
jgi:hypothetical protein